MLSLRKWAWIDMAGLMQVITAILLFLFCIETVVCGRHQGMQDMWVGIATHRRYVGTRSRNGIIDPPDWCSAAEWSFFSSWDGTRRGCQDVFAGLLTEARTFALCNFLERLTTLKKRRSAVYRKLY